MSNRFLWLVVHLVLLVLASAPIVLCVLAPMAAFQHSSRRSTELAGQSQI